MFVITGGGTGIGRALAHALAKKNHQVLVIGRHAKTLEETAQATTLIQTLEADITTDVGRLCVLKALDGVVLQGLIHNAAVIEPIKPAITIRSDEWTHALTTNLTAPLLLTQMLIPALTQGRILHMGTGAAHVPIKGWGAYCVSKAALFMLTRILQVEIACDDVAITSVMPGIIDTPMQQVIRDNPQGMDADKSGFFNTLYRENRLIKPETVALFLSWLLLDTSTSLYASQEWDIYDVTHHDAWLKAPHIVPSLN